LIGNDSKKATLTSMDLNLLEQASLPSLEEKGKFDVLDVPGQGFFRTKIIETLPNAKMVILFLDSEEKESILRASDYLYELVNSENFDEMTPVLIACNKQDSRFPKTKKLIETEMANEVENIKQIKQKNNLEDSSQIGALFAMKSKFSFYLFENIFFVETDKSSDYASLIKLINELL
jgi:signal recognition particle receptor subunit beta